MPDRYNLPIPSLYDARKILAIQPHYDDNDIPAGGTLAALAARGIEVVYLTCSDDQMGVIDENWSFKEADARLKRDQKDAAQFIGVKRQHWLQGYPDAGEYNYFALRRDIMKIMRLESPDTVFTVDPWLPYEAHTDHIMVGKAAAEAVVLCGFKRIKTDPEVDAAYTPHEVQCVAFYGSQRPNTCFDISTTIEKKKQAVRCYHAQFHEEELEMLAGYVEARARKCAEGRDFAYGENLKVITSHHLHANTSAWNF